MELSVAEARLLSAVERRQLLLVSLPDHAAAAGLHPLADQLRALPAGRCGGSCRLICSGAVGTAAAAGDVAGGMVRATVC